MASSTIWEFPRRALLRVVFNWYACECDFGEAEAVEVADGLHQGESAKEREPFNSLRLRVRDDRVADGNFVTFYSRTVWRNQREPVAGMSASGCVRDC